MSVVYSEVVHAAYKLQKRFKEMKKNQVADQSTDSVAEKCACDNQPWPHKIHLGRY